MLKKLFLWVCSDLHTLPGTLNKSQLDLKNPNLGSNLSIDDFLAAEMRAASINSFSVSCFRVMESAGDQDLSRFRTWLMFQVTKYFGSGGRKQKNPFMNFVTSGGFPMTKRSIGMWNAEIADL